MSKTAVDVAKSRVHEACEVLYAYQDQAKKRLEAKDTRGVLDALAQIRAAKSHLRDANQILKEVTMTETATATKRIMWELPVLTQTADHCVGYAFASAAGAPEQAERIQAIAKTLDRWPGEDYYGTTVAAGAEAAKALGIIESYDWQLTAGAMLDALAVGPLVFGAYWTPGMLKPAAGGMMAVDAPKHRSVAHCAVVVGYDPLANEVCIQSSWGTAWAENGRGWLPLADLERLTFRSGEACLVVPA